ACELKIWSSPPAAFAFGRAGWVKRRSLVAAGALCVAAGAGATFFVRATFFTALCEDGLVRLLGGWRPAVAGWVGFGSFWVAGDSGEGAAVTGAAAPVAPVAPLAGSAVATFCCGLAVFFGTGYTRAREPSCEYVYWL